MSLPKTPIDLSREWHVLLEGRTLGPYTLAALCEQLESHPDGWSAPVWRQGMLDWRPAQQIEALTQDAKPVVNAGPAETPAAAPRDVAVFMHPTPPRSHFATSRMAETTRDMPVVRPARRAVRAFHVAAALGGVVVLSVALAFFKSRAVPAPMHVPVLLARGTARLDVLLARGTARRDALGPAAMASGVPQTAPQGQRPPQRPGEVVAAQGRAQEVDQHASTASAALLPEPKPRAPAVREGMPTALEVTSVRIRAPWAPIRVGIDGRAVVLCSVPRGTVLRVFAQLPGRKARWFAVRCDPQTVGWVHENFLASVR